MNDLQPHTEPARTVLVSGGSGFIGQALIRSLRQHGFFVLELTRSLALSQKPPCPDHKYLFWNPKTGECSHYRDFNSVIHLAGENIAGWWSRAKKERIRSSRVETTSLLINYLGQLTHPPRTFLAASAVGVYGDRGDHILDESSDYGSGFLADLGREWETASQRAERFGARVALLRFGIVLDPSGGALSKMITPFKFGLGGRFGTGRQFMSWITRDDLVRGIEFILSQHNLQGAFNFTSPSPCTNGEFTKILAATLNRPALLPVPADVLKLLLGEFAKEALLASQRALPKKLQDAGFSFNDTDLCLALQRMLKC